MKKTITLFSLVLALMSSAVAQVQYPLNGGFENWFTASFGGTTYDSIGNWDTPQRLGAALGVPDTVTFRTTNARSGDFAVLMKSKEVTISLGPTSLTVVIPGAVTTGTFVVNILVSPPEFGVAGGAPIDCKPTEFSGYYQYMPVNDDTAQVSVIMIDGSGAEIAEELFQIFVASSPGYQPFSFPINYTGSGDPVTAQILITSSGIGGQDGSTLYLDDVVLSGGDCVTGLNLFSSPQSIELIPNPAHDAIRFNLPAESPMAAAIMDLSGRSVLQVQALPGMNQVDISQLATGVYIISIADAGKTVFSGKFEKF